jgi:PAS domain S-box-containing protein
VARPLGDPPPSDRTAHARFARLIEHAPDATLLVAADGTITLASRRISALLGWDPADLIGHSVEVLIPAHLRGIHQQHRTGYLQAPRAREMGQGLELVALHRDGSEVAVEISLAPVTFQDDEQAVMVALRDVTQRRETQRALAEELERQRHAARELEQNDEVRSRFLETLAHDLRTPLSAIVGFTELLLERAVPPEQARDLLQRIARNAQAVSGLVSDLQEFARLQRGGVTLDRREVDLSSILEELCDQLASVTATHKVTCVAPPGLTVHADERALTRILTNLLTNATRYSPPESWIQVTARREDGDAVVEVSDEGPGIPPEDRERIFDMFYRGTDPAVMAQPGSGIGLSVVRDLLSLQDGTVAVIEGVTSGATMQIRMPLAT